MALRLNGASHSFTPLLGKAFGHDYCVLKKEAATESVGDRGRSSLYRATWIDSVYTTNVLLSNGAGAEIDSVDVLLVKDHYSAMQLFFFAAVKPGWTSSRLDLAGDRYWAPSKSWSDV